MGIDLEAALTKGPKNKAPGGAPKGNLNSTKHRHYAREAALQGGQLDRRTRTYRAAQRKMREYRKALAGKMTPQIEFLIREAALFEHVLIDPLDPYLAGVRLVRKGRPHPLLEIRLKLSAHVRDLLQLAGLDKVKRQSKLPWR